MEKRPQVEAIEGEYGFVFSFFVKYANGDAYTGFAGDETVTFNLKPTDTDTDAFSIGTGAVHDTATGEVRVTIASGDNATLTKDWYVGQLEIVGTGYRLIVNDIDVHIKRRIGS